MDRTQFDNDRDVNDFVEWIGQFELDDEGHLRQVEKPTGVSRIAAIPALPMLPVTLAIGRSKWNPTPIVGTFPLHALTRVYCWRAAGMRVGDFAETRALIAAMSLAISTARTTQAADAAWDAILIWGGERDRSKGARPFLNSRANILAYLGGVKRDLALNSAILPPIGTLANVLAMNSMLTKVHAFNSGDGLPIYDSRVAGAIATVVETWRQKAGKQGLPLPDTLTFPAAGGGGQRRHVHCRYPGCADPATLRYQANSSPARAARDTLRWSSAKVRLGWLLSRLLVKPSAGGIRSLEACLFMAGYDCTGINVP